MYGPTVGRRWIAMSRREMNSTRRWSKKVHAAGLQTLSAGQRRGSDSRNRDLRVAAPEFLQIGLGTALSLVANVVVDWAIQHDSDLFTGKHVGKDTSELVRVLGHGLMIWGVRWVSGVSWVLLSGDVGGNSVGAVKAMSLVHGADELYKTLMKRTDNVQRVFTNQIPQLITMASNLVMNIGFLWFSKPRLCAFGIGMFAFQNIGNSVFDNILRLARDHDHKLEEVKERENALEVLQNFRTVRAFGREEKEKQSFHSCMAQALRLRFSDVVDKFTDLGCWFVSEFTFQVAYMYGGILVNLNYIKATEVKDAVSKSFRAVWPLYQLRRQLTHQSTFMEDAAAVLEALERPPEIPFGDERMFSPSTEKINGRIEAKGVCFSYSDDLDAAALKEVTFEIPCGSMVGLVGPSGCGKSTLFNLLLRFYDPQKGAIEVDGVDLAKWNPQALYRAVSWVSQDQCVFTGSVIENIRYGMPHATEEEVLQVMREADLYDDVMKKPSGVATAASELSGGQKQRLSIARALLRNPKILLLDEATSALDTVSERKVQKALEKLMKGRTVIAIAHRLSTIMNADLILVMEAGKVIEQGTHTELLKKSGGKYANLVQQQLAVEDKKDDTSADPKVAVAGERWWRSVQPSYSCFERRCPRIWSKRWTEQHKL
ncbi:ATP-binding cassette sub-family B member 10 [Durusdinium trenchii]|uniref:Mitochondrial (ABC-mitochondrial erythroid protein) (ABC-me protein) (ATP-binding cassette transporter 10) (ABC transporter 10 protein) n=1 Tax=Durusdinium trenchii TaxID=1381693 RepID=A0ABP0JQG8_9DINO